MTRVRALLLVVAFSLPATLLAQVPDTTELPLTTTHLLAAGRLDSLPVDSLRTALGFLPGVVPGSRGDLYIRGGSPDGLVTYLDGVPVQPGVRGGGIGTHVGALTPWATGLESAEITTGPYGAEFGNGTSGLLTLHTRSGPDHWTGGARYSTDELSGKAASFGVNRIEGSVGGPLGGKVRLFFGAFVHGQQSAASGLDGAAAPIFVPAGVDTTLAVPSAYGNPAADTTYVRVANWAVYRGDCSEFSHSPDPGVASNYGVACQGDRIPMSASTSARYQLRLDATPDARTELWLSAVGGRDQARIFDYNLIQDAQAMTAFVNDSRVWTLGLGRSLSPTVRVEAALSLQHDQSQNGPLDPAEEINTRDPFGGFFIAPLKLRFNLSNFPVDEQLVTNYQENIAGSRRSPYDLNNTSQYEIIDQWRNDAYGLQGYAEGGGPTGRLSLYRETRAIGRATVTWRAANSGTFTFGVEGTHYNIANYSHQLVTQIYSDVWIEKPVTTAAYLTDRIALGGVTIDAGLRYDHFRTGAERPWLLDTVSTSPTFGAYAPFPRLSTYGRNSDGSIVTFGGKPLLDLRADAAHGALSPHLAIAGRVGDRTTLHAAIARQVQVPDFAISFASINTDLALTNARQSYGSDLGFLDATVLEAGITRALAPGLAGSATAYHRRDVARTFGRFTDEYDPSIKATQGLFVAQNEDGGTTDGVELDLSGRVGLLSGEVSYAYQHASHDVSILSGPDAGDRPHTLSAAVTLALPAGWRAGTLAGRLLSRTAATAELRYASGARDYLCASATPVSPTGVPCPAPDPYSTFPTEQPRLPAFKIVDLRVSRAIDLAGHPFSVFVDAHNLFNFRNYTLAVDLNANTSSSRDEAQAWSSDSAGYASEATQNGVYSTGTGNIDLTFGGAADPRTGCGAWMTSAGSPASPNCVYLIQAEQRFGNGDGIFSVAEQRRASEAQYLLGRGLAALTDLPRRIRIGIEMTL